jgi:hypothetical protein
VADKLPVRAIRIAAAVVFTVIGLFALLKGDGQDAREGDVSILRNLIRSRTSQTALMTPPVSGVSR